MSRKKVSEAEKKTVRMTFRMEEELAKLMTSRAEEMGLSMSQYLRLLAESKPMVRLETKQNLQRIKYELSMIGTNMNQIAHALNGGYYHYPEDAERINETIADLKKALEKIREFY